MGYANVRMWRFTLLLVVVACAAGCGYLASGTWDDDPRSWGKAFQSERPPDVVVVHSRYSRFPHFTHEFEYYFELAPNAALERQLLTANRLVRFDAAVWDRPRSAPAWFAPKPLDAYEVWGRATARDEDFRVLVDRSTRELFITDMQL